MNRKSLLSLLLGLALLLTSLPAFADSGEAMITIKDAALAEHIAKALKIEKPTNGQFKQSDMDKLEELILPPVEPVVKDLSGLEGASRLTKLVASEQDIADLKPLQSITTLEVLNLNDNAHLSDLSPLANLTKLKQLYIEHTSVLSLAPLQALQSIEAIGFRGTGISDIAPLGNCPLSWIALDGTRVVNLSPLQGKALTHFFGMEVRFIAYASEKEMANPIKDQTGQFIGFEDTDEVELSPDRSRIILKKYESMKEGDEAWAPFLGKVKKADNTEELFQGVLVIRKGVPRPLTEEVIGGKAKVNIDMGKSLIAGERGKVIISAVEAGKVVGKVTLNGKALPLSGEAGSGYTAEFVMPAEPAHIRVSLVEQVDNEVIEATLHIASPILRIHSAGKDRSLTMDAPPFIQDGRTMVPMRAVGEAIGFKVDWDKATRTVSLTDKANKVVLPVDTTTIIVNNKFYEADTKTIIKNNRTYLSIANVAQAVNVSRKDIGWEQATGKVTIKRRLPA